MTHHQIWLQQEAKRLCIAKAFRPQLAGTQTSKRHMNPCALLAKGSASGQGAIRQLMTLSGLVRLTAEGPLFGLLRRYLIVREM